MAFIDTHNLPVIDLARARSVAMEWAEGLRAFAAGQITDPDTAEMFDFSARRLRAAQLPQVETCQSRLFASLRQAEEGKTGARHLRNAKTRRRLFAVPGLQGLFGAARLH